MPEILVDGVKACHKAVIPEAVYLQPIDFLDKDITHKIIARSRSSLLDEIFEKRLFYYKRIARARIRPGSERIYFDVRNASVVIHLKAHIIELLIRVK